MIALVCPGQGAQTPGFLAPWLDLPGSRELMTELGEHAGLDLVAYGTLGDEETIKDTAIAQPLIVAAGILSGQAVLGSAGGAAASVIGGHSVGELTAAALAAVISPADAVAVVAARGRAMAAASAITPTGMSAVLGGEADEVLSRLAELDLTPANANGGGQIVAAGTLDHLAKLSQSPPARARVIPLKVAGAFHTQHMAPAVPALQQAADQVDPQTAVTDLVCNADGAIVRDGAQVMSRIVAQITRPVRWDLCMQTLADRGVTGIIEVAPAGTLVGLAKRALKGVPSVAVRTPDDLAAAHELLAAAGGTR